MPKKYKVGDVAALLPGKPRSESGKQLASLFEQFHSKSEKFNKERSEKVSEKAPLPPAQPQSETVEQPILNKSTKSTKKPSEKVSKENEVALVAALSPAKQQSEPGKRLLSLFEEFYSKSTKYKKENPEKLPSLQEPTKTSQENKKEKSLSSKKCVKRKLSEANEELSNDLSTKKLKKKSKDLNPKKGTKKRKPSESDEELSNDLSNKKLKKKSKDLNPKKCTKRKLSESNEESANDLSNKKIKKKFPEDDELSIDSSDKKLKKKFPEDNQFSIDLSDKKFKKRFPEDIEREDSDDNNEIAEFEENECESNERDRRPKKKNKQSLNEEEGEAAPLPYGGRDDKEKLSCTLFVGNIPMSMTRKDLKKLFKKYGAVVSARLRLTVAGKEKISRKIAENDNKCHPKLKRRIGYVEFEKEEDAVSALALNGFVINKHHITVDRATAPGEKMMYDPKLTIFIGNVPFDVDDDTIWNAFSKYGTLQCLRVVRDRETGAGKGFGFVVFKDVAAKQEALTFDDVEIYGRKLRLKSSNEPRKVVTRNRKNGPLWSSARKIYKKQRKNPQPSSRKTIANIAKKNMEMLKKKIIIKQLSSCFTK